MGFRWIINYFDNGDIKSVTVTASNVYIALSELVETGDVQVYQIHSIIKL
jgi:hypothetical protein